MQRDNTFSNFREALFCEKFIIENGQNVRIRFDAFDISIREHI